MRPFQIPSAQLVLRQVQGFGLAELFMKADFDEVFFYLE